MKIELTKEEIELICDMMQFAYSPEIEGSFFNMIYEDEGAEESDKLYDLYDKIVDKLRKAK